MLILRDLYTQTGNIQFDIGGGATTGQSVIQYEVRAYTDTRNLGDQQSYLVSCTQRLIIANPTVYSPSPGNTTGYSAYPALLYNVVSISDPNKIVQSLQLVDYSPQTLNTAVVSSQNTAQSSNQSVSQQYTSGSSTAQTNSFGGSVSLGFFGDLPTGDISGNYEHSSSTDRSSSLSKGNAVDTGSQLSNSSSMTIKDWGAYTTVDTASQSITWIWGQEYPWNVIQFKNENAQDLIVLPAYVAQRLYDGTQVYPPSELSLFGVNFVAKATWLITLKSAQAVPQGITFSHALTYGLAEHSVSNQQLTAAYKPYPQPVYDATIADLPMLALDPIQTSDRGPAIIGFLPSQFDVPPAGSNTDFSITSKSNNLLVRGSGLSVQSNTTFNGVPVKLAIYFKLVDGSRDLSLSLKHWVGTTATPCQLAVVINGSLPLTRYVDAPETGSGGENVTTIALRNSNFTSVDYCDYLQMGLNTVDITITPVDTQPGTTTSYQLMALAVG